MNSKSSPAAEEELEFRRIDHSFDTGELLDRIREILNEGDSHNAATFSRENWRWQYEDLPTGDARIYVCLCAGRIVGYYHVPVYAGVVAGEKKLFAMVQDVAVSREMRGRGVFRKLAEFATEDLINSNINLIYTFPNHKSIPTFLKYNGYRQIYTYDSYVLPVKSAAVIKSKIKMLGAENVVGWFADRFFDATSQRLQNGFKVESQTHFDEPTLNLFRDFNREFVCHLERSADYLQWRFFDKPHGKHFLVTVKNENETLAAAVFKIDVILDTETAVILDFAFKEEKHLAQLFHFVRKNAETLFGETINLLFTACCCRRFLHDKSFGFVKIPAKFNPRPLNLLVKNITESENVFDDKNWLALLSDWDVL
jgi:GNAT superfamily N-acetyltransferase